MLKVENTIHWVNHDLVRVSDSAILASHDFLAVLARQPVNVETVIDHFTVVGLVTWPLNGSEAGVDLVLIQTSLLCPLLLLCKSSCSYAN